MAYSRRTVLASALALSMGSSVRARHARAVVQGTTDTGSPGTSMFRGNPDRTGTNPGPGPRGAPSERWRFRVGTGEFISSPALSGNLLYVGSTDGNVYAVDTVSGQEAWRAETGSPVISSPAAVEGVVYVGSFGTLAAFDATSGSPLWQFSTESAVDSSPVAVDGVVYVGSSDGNLHAVDAKTGEPRGGPFPTGSPVLSSPAVHAGVIYVGAFGLIYALRAEDLSEVGRFTVDGPVDTALTVLNDKVYAVTAKGRVYAFNVDPANPQTGASPVADSENTQTGTSPVWETSVGGQVFSSPAVAAVGGQNYIFISCGDSNLYALNSDTGDEAWRVPQIPVFGPLASSPAVVPSEGILYIGVGDGSVMAITISTHQPQEGWPLTVGSRVDSSPVVRDGSLYVGSADGLIAIGGDGD